MSMKLHIDWTQCDGRGLCIELLPEILAEDDWAFPMGRDGSGNDVNVPAKLVPYAQRSVAQCPRSALRLSG
jgi:ferredoxin